MTDLSRRKTLGSLGAAAALGSLGFKPARSQGIPDEIVIGASQPITGVFAFAGVAMNNGLADFVSWKNANGGVMGRRLRYVSEDSGFKLDQGVAIFKKIMAAERPNFFYGDSTQWSKAVAQDVLSAGTVMTSSTSLASSMADPVSMPQHFVPGPIYGSMHEILMEYIAQTWTKPEKPKIAYIYTEFEFGRDGIPAGKARAEKLGLPIVAEIMTKQAGIDVAPEVAKLRRAKPDFVIFQGYILAPMPEFARQMREAGLRSQIMGTAWGLDKPAYDALGAMGEELTGVSPYRYGHETDSPMINAMRDFAGKNRPEMKHISPFYISSWLSGMVFAEIAERCIKENKPFTLSNMKAALESMKEWDSGGLIGMPVDYSSHQTRIGRIYRYKSQAKTMEPVSAWIKV